MWYYDSKNPDIPLFDTGLLFPAAVLPAATTAAATTTTATVADAAVVVVVVVVAAAAADTGTAVPAAEAAVDASSCLGQLLHPLSPAFSSIQSLLRHWMPSQSVSLQPS